MENFSFLINDKLDLFQILVKVPEMCSDRKTITYLPDIFLQLTVHTNVLNMGVVHTIQQTHTDFFVVFQLHR